MHIAYIAAPATDDRFPSQGGVNCQGSRKAPFGFLGHFRIGRPGAPLEGIQGRLQVQLPLGPNRRRLGLLITPYAGFDSHGTPAPRHKVT